MDNLSEVFFKKQIDFFNTHQRFSDCKYYPCHKTEDDNQNCFFCYCPFYPCFSSDVGGRIIKGKKGDVWDCSLCTFIHRDDVVKRVLSMIYENKRVEDIKKEIFSKDSFDKY